MDLNLSLTQHLAILISTNVALVTKLLIKKNLNSMSNIVSLVIDLKVIYIES